MTSSYRRTSLLTQCVSKLFNYTYDTLAVEHSMFPKSGFNHFETKGLVAHACNPSYLGGRDQEDCSSKPAQANSSQDPILKKTHQKKQAGGVAQGVGPEFKLQ
jgi:hypothetical protein